MTSFRSSMNEGPMSRFQWMAISICVVLVMLDGFDVLVMAFTAAAISAEWKLTGAQLGVLFRLQQESQGQLRIVRTLTPTRGDR